MFALNHCSLKINREELLYLQRKNIYKSTSQIDFLQNCMQTAFAKYQIKGFYSPLTKRAHLFLTLLIMNFINPKPKSKAVSCVERGQLAALL